MRRVGSLASILIAFTAGPAPATDGLIEINQAAVFAGGITPGDMPGFPATLTLPGSYRLTGNLDVTRASDGSPQPGAENLTAVEAAASDLTLDLNGFAISGPAACGGSPTVCSPTGTGHGIHAEAGDNVTVVNGTVRGMGSTGLSLLGNNGRAERVRAIGNGGSGVELGPRGIASGCLARSNRLFGIAGIGAGFVFTDNLAADNGYDGIHAAGDATAIGNGAHGNFGAGLSLGSVATAVANSVAGNQNVGLMLGAQAGYGQNAIAGNNGGNANPQVSSGVQLSPNLCGSDLVCP